MTLPDPRTMRLILLSVILLILFGLFIRAQFMRKSDNPFDFWDLWIDHNTNRASLDSTITLLCCFVGLWYAIARATDTSFDPNGGAGTFLLQLIGIMVIYRGVKTGAQAYVARGPSPPPVNTEQLNINQPTGAGGSVAVPILPAKPELPPKPHLPGG